MNRYFYYILSVIAVLSQSANAQILDDSTKQVYGFHSTQYFTERDIFRDDTSKSRIDTSFDATIQRYDKQYFRDNIYQNLGNLGTASKAVFWQQPSTIGYTFGYHVYDQYASNVLNTKYMDTKSPYTLLRYVQSGTGENSLNFDFSRNITDLFNFGINVQRLTSVKQIGRKVQRDRNVDQWDFGFNASFHTRNKRFIALTSFARFSTLVRETGGIRPDSVVFNQTDLDLYDQSPVKLSDSARTLDDRTNFRYYHQFSLVPKNRFNLFHSFTYSNQYSGFTDKRLTSSSVSGKTLYESFIYPQYSFDTNQTVYRANFNSISNTVGFKSDLKNLKIRAFTTFENNAYKQIIKSDSTDKLSFDVTKVGAEADYYLSAKTYLTLSALSQMSLDASSENANKKVYIVNNKDYNLNISFVSDYFKAGFISSKYSPTLQQTQYCSNNYAWSNENLKPIQSQHLYAKVFKTFSKQKFELMASYTDVKNYVYYQDTASVTANWREKIIVSQGSDKGFQMLSGELFAGFNLGDKVFIDNQIRYTKTTGEDIYRVPSLYISSMIYYQKKFSKDLGLQFGFDIHYRSAYKADAYSAVLQQFVLQNNFKNNAFTVVDVFANLKIKKATAWVKFSQLNQSLQKVYFVTPYYPGMSLAFHFGVNWAFFD